jgi:hypothetical protein
VTRHRGKSPRQAAFFFRNPEVTFHAAQLASLFLIYGLVGAASGGLESHYRVGSLDSGILLCQTYEAYLELHTPVSISFEHAWFLLLALARRDEWASPAATNAAACDCATCWPGTNRFAAIANRSLLDGTIKAGRGWRTYRPGRHAARGRSADQLLLLDEENTPR